MKEIYWTMFELTVNLFQSALVLQTLRMLLGDKKIKLKPELCYFAFTFILFLELVFINSIVPFEGLGIIISIGIIYTYALSCLRGSGVQKLFWSIFIMLLIMGITAVVFNLEGYIVGKTYLNLASQKSSDRFLGVVVIQIVLFYLTRLIIRKVRKKNIYSLKWNEWFVLLIIQIISIFTMTFVALISINAEHEISRIQQMFSVMSIIGILGTNFWVYGLYIKIQREHKKQLEYEMLQQRIKNQEKSLKETKLLYQSIRKIRHDLKQHFGIVLMMLQEEKYKEAMQYLETYNDTVICSVSNKVFCNNDVINYIINSKCRICGDKGIETYIYVSNEVPNLSDLDLCVLLGNALDNAIEGVPEKGKKEIYIELRTDDNFFMISVRNSIRESVLEKNPNLNSTKNKKEQHGLGIISMREVTEKYNGSINFREENNIFFCDILLDIPEELQFRTDEVPNRPIN